MPAAEGARSPAEDEVLGALLAETSRLLSREVDAARIDREAHIPARVLDAARAIGLFATTIPTAYGGLGLSLEGACAVVERIARVDRSIAISIRLAAGPTMNNA